MNLGPLIKRELVLWLWVGLFIVLATEQLIGLTHGFGGHEPMAVLFALALAGSAASSLRRDRESGFLELVLVSPVAPPQIIGGRLRAIYYRFLPAMGLLVWYWWWYLGLGSDYEFSYLYSPSWLETTGSALFGERGRGGGIFLLAICGLLFLVVPVVGLFWSVRTRQFLSGFAMTVLLGLVLPFASVALLPVLDGWMNGTVDVFLPWYYYISRGLVLVGTAALGVFCYRRLRRRLERRDVGGV